MEFKYKGKSLIWFLAFFLIGGWGIINIVGDIFSGSFYMRKSVIWTPIIFVIGLGGLVFYLKQRKVIVFFNEDGITVKGKSRSSNYIKWDDVLTTEVIFLSTFYPFYKDSFVIIIKSATDEIKIGSEVNDIVTLVNFMEGKLGGRFDTSTIPFECKIKQRKW